MNHVLKSRSCRFVADSTKSSDELDESDVDNGISIRGLHLQAPTVMRSTCIPSFKPLSSMRFLLVICLSYYTLLIRYVS